MFVRVAWKMEKNRHNGDSDGGRNNGDNTSKQAGKLAAKSTPKNQGTK
jgi:hypothetical protein